jgi:hypothetical protein
MELAAETRTVRLLSGDRVLELQSISGLAGVAPARASFSAGGLAGAWDVQFRSLERFVYDLERLHADLKGEAILSDDDSLALAFTVGHRGEITANVWIGCGWAFGIGGEIAFEMLLDQSYLPALLSDFRALLSRQDLV